MVPRVAGKGRSFKGAGLYYLHDKKAMTSERVAFTHTLGLATDDPDKAIRFMAHTAMSQSEIKARAGGATKGRKLRDPVYTYSLSWAPDETPSRDEMIDAAKTTLGRLGLDGHEALLVAHKDEPHPHIHVIVNRVHPETGIAAKLANDHLKLSSWAEAYEKQQGQIRCEQRVENNERRRAGEYVKHRERDTKQDYYRLRRQLADKRVELRQAELRHLSDTHKAELRDLKREIFEQGRENVRAETKHFWRATYQGQKRERAKLAVKHDAALDNLKDYLDRRKRRKEHGKINPYPSGLLSGAFQTVLNGDAERAALDAKHLQERKNLAARIDLLHQAEADRLAPVFAKQKEQLKEFQKAERDELKDRHKRESEDEARRIKREQIDDTAYEKRMAESKYKLRFTQAMIEALKACTDDFPDHNKLAAEVRARLAREDELAAEKKAAFKEAARDAGKGSARRAHERAVKQQARSKDQSKDAAKDTDKKSARRTYEEKAPPRPKQDTREQPAPRSSGRDRFRDNASDIGRERPPPGGPGKGGRKR